MQDLFDHYDALVKPAAKAPAKKRTFLGIAKPSQALRAMVEGLKEAEEQKGFTIDFLTYGETRHGRPHCYGDSTCCALQKLGGVKFNADTIHRRGRSTLLGTTMEDMARFETVMEKARCGDVADLFDFFGLDLPRGVRADFRLTNEDWREELPKVETLIKQLETKGC